MLHINIKKSPHIQGGEMITCKNSEINHNNLINYLQNKIEETLQREHIGYRTIISARSVISFICDKKIEKLNIPYAKIKVKKIVTTAITEYLYQIYINNPNKTIQELNKPCVFNLGKYTKDYISFKNDEIYIYTDKADKIIKDLKSRSELSLKVGNSTIMIHNENHRIFDNLVIYHSDDSFVIMMLLAPGCIEELTFWIKKYHKFNMNILIDGKVISTLFIEKNFAKQVFLKKFDNYNDAINFIYRLKNSPLPVINVISRDAIKTDNTFLILILFEIMALIAFLFMCIYLRKYRELIITILSKLFYYYLTYKINDELSLLIIGGSMIGSALLSISFYLNSKYKFSGFIALIAIISTLIVVNFIVKNMFLLNIIQLINLINIFAGFIIALSFIVYFAFKDRHVK